MPTFYQQCRIYFVVCAAMLAFGIALPWMIAYAGSDIVLSPFVYNVLQIGGLLGMVVFGLAKRTSNPARREVATA